MRTPHNRRQIKKTSRQKIKGGCYFYEVEYEAVGKRLY